MEGMRKEEIQFIMHRGQLIHTLSAGLVFPHILSPQNRLHGAVPEIAQSAPSPASKSDSVVCSTRLVLVQNKKGS